MERRVFLYDEKINKCPVTAALEMMGGKWKPIILYILAEGPHRFGEIKKRLPKITQKILTQMLRDLEKDKLIKRKVYRSIPPKVEYSLSELGICLQPIIDQVYNWGVEHCIKDNITRGQHQQKEEQLSASNLN